MPSNCLAAASGVLEFSRMPLRDETPLAAALAAARAEGLSGEALDRRVWSQHGTRCAMLALDGSGMTRVSRSHGIVHFLARYLEMRELAVAVLERHGCTGWRGFADNLFAEFAGCVPAVRAAEEIHAALCERRLMLTETENYRVCIGIGYGDVLSNGPAGVMGDEMNLTAKLAEDVAGPGETLLTAAAHRSLDVEGAWQFRVRRESLSQVEFNFFQLIAE